MTDNQKLFFNQDLFALFAMFSISLMISVAIWCNQNFNNILIFGLIIHIFIMIVSLVAMVYVLFKNPPN